MPRGVARDPAEKSRKCAEAAKARWAVWNITPEQLPATVAAQLQVMQEALLRAQEAVTRLADRTAAAEARAEAAEEAARKYCQELRDWVTDQAKV